MLLRGIEVIKQVVNEEHGGTYYAHQISQKNPSATKMKGVLVPNNNHNSTDFQRRCQVCNITTIGQPYQWIQMCPHKNLKQFLRYRSVRVPP